MTDYPARLAGRCLLKPIGVLAGAAAVLSLAACSASPHATSAGRSALPAQSPAQAAKTLTGKTLKGSPAPAAVLGKPTISRAELNGQGQAVVVETATVVEPATVVRISSNAGQSWTQLRLPAVPATGQSIAVTGSTVSALTVDAHGMAVQRSTDGGRSWSRTAVALSIPTDQADLAVSADGSRVAVMASVQGSANDGNTPELLIGKAGGTLTARSAPASGSMAWAGNTLLLAGGSLNSRLYSSLDGGADWSSLPVGGSVAPRFNLDPNTPSIAAPLVGSDGAVTLPVTDHAGTRSSVQLFSSSNGKFFSSGVRVALASDVGSGAIAVVSAAGPGTFLVAEPGSTVLHLVHGAGQSRFTPTGLPAPVDSMSFSDAEHGIAQVTVRSCGATKQSCASAVRVLQSSDGGHSWTDTAAGA